MRNIPQITRDKFFNTYRKIKGRICNEVHGSCIRCGLFLAMPDGKFVCMADIVEGAMSSTFPEEAVKHIFGEENLLILTIKKKWFDMILSGEKQEEYRELKPYYISRFKNIGLLDEYSVPVKNAKYWILFRNGYSASSPAFKALCSLDIRTGNSEWGAEPSRLYYVLTILKIIKD